MLSNLYVDFGLFFRLLYMMKVDITMLIKTRIPVAVFLVVHRNVVQTAVSVVL